MQRSAKAAEFLRLSAIHSTPQAGFLECALWLGMDMRPEMEGANDNSIDLRSDYSGRDVYDEALEEMADDLDGFVLRLQDEGLLPDDYIPDTEFGADFNLTRNGHGCGFWDGDWDHMGEGWGRKVSDIAKEFGDFTLSLYDNSGIVFSS